jgi:DNA-binding response OmpR family regulator
MIAASFAMVAAVTRILVVDDDPAIRLLLRQCLEEEGYRVSEAGTGAQTLEQLASQTFDLVTLDLRLPDSDGLTLSRKIRERTEVPIIMVTGKNETVDKIVGLELGADDYITKPFQLREVVARVRAVLRRVKIDDGGTKAHGKSTFRFAGWLLDVAKRELMSGDGRLCELTTSEFDLLVVFATHPNRVLSRDQIMDLLRGHDWSPTDRSIDNLIVRLRRKIEPDPARPSLVKSVRGVGYCFSPDTGA